MLHDGYTDQLYALLPVWQSEFGLSYAGLAAVRAMRLEPFVDGPAFSLEPFSSRPFISSLSQSSLHY